MTHRGGGPFGAGRVGDDKLEQLEASLRAAVLMLEKDTADAFGGQGAEAAVGGAVKEAPVQVQPQMQQKQQQQQMQMQKAKSPPQQTEKPAQRYVSPAAAAPAPAPAPARPPAPAPAPAPSGSDSVPIAVGLDSFLSDPQGLGVAELSGLRDGLIQVLGLLAAEIASRPVLSAVAPASAQGGAPNLPGQQVLERATDRIASMTRGAGEASVEREAKLALGLLLKHRGGPGFGHGRLDGASYDQRAPTLYIDITLRKYCRPSLFVLPNIISPHVAPSPPPPAPSAPPPTCRTRQRAGHDGGQAPQRHAATGGRGHSLTISRSTAWPCRHFDLVCNLLIKSPCRTLGPPPSLGATSIGSCGYFI